MNRNLSRETDEWDDEWENDDDFPVTPDDDFEEFEPCEYCNLQGPINNRLHLIGCPNGLLS